MSEELPAEELLARMAKHDVAALSEFYDRYAPRVYGLVAHILPARDDAEEILRELFLRLWSESPRLSQEGRSVAAWLVVTARDTAVERRRALRKNGMGTGPQVAVANAAKGPGTTTRKLKVASPLASPTKSPEGKAVAPPPPAPDGARVPAIEGVPCAWLPQPKEITLIDERLTLLHKVIDQLPKPQRQALEFAVFEGMSESEIATQTGEPLGKVQRWLRAAVTFVKHRRRAVCGTWAANI